MEKNARLLQLGKQRQEATKPGNPWAESEYTNLADHPKNGRKGVYEVPFVSPWTKSAGNVNADVMVFGQDWSSSDSLDKDVNPVVVAQGWNPRFPTNRKLQALLKDHFHLEWKDVYGTNLFPFIKQGKTNADIPLGHMVRAAKEFGLPELEIVDPKIVICLGVLTFNALHLACDAKAQLFEDRPEAIASPFCHCRSLLFCQTHTGTWMEYNRGGDVEIGIKVAAQNSQRERGKEQVAKDWKKMVSCYRNMPDDRGQFCEWLLMWWKSQEIG